jgi:hypothetical protein
MGPTAFKEIAAPLAIEQGSVLLDGDVKGYIPILVALSVEE